MGRPVVFSTGTPKTTNCGPNPEFFQNTQTFETVSKKSEVRNGLMSNESIPRRRSRACWPKRNFNWWCLNHSSRRCGCILSCVLRSGNINLGVFGNRWNCLEHGLCLRLHHGPVCYYVISDRALGDKILVSRQVSLQASVSPAIRSVLSIFNLWWMFKGNWQI